MPRVARQKFEGEDEAQRLSLKKKLLATWTWQDLVPRAPGVLL